MQRAWSAAAAYTALAVLMTWPVARGLGRDVAFDLGDPLLNMWILSWVCEQLLAVLSGDFARIRTSFDANIFHPEPLTLAYSEHLVAQALQILPVYAASRNPILSYNLLFLSTFVLSGVGTYLLVRELTGSPRAAFAAGVLFAFTPYRVPQSSHLQILSSQWMPFALYGLARYCGTQRTGPLAGAVAALVLQNLSSGYYLFYFAPFAVAFTLWEIGRRGLWRELTVWRDLSIAAIATTVITLPFLLPYAWLRERLGVERGLAEVVRYSADVYSYLTASSLLRVWGDVAQAFPKAEGELFLGALPMMLALVGTCAAWLQARPTHVEAPASRIVSVVAPVSGALALLGVTLLVALLFVRRFSFDLGLFEVRVTNGGRLLLQTCVAFVVLLVLSRRARHRWRLFVGGAGFFLLAFAAAVWLSLGPTPRSLGRVLQLPSPYLVLYEHVPGFDGLRVPARFAMIGSLMLAVLAGFGAAWILRLRRGGVAIAALTVGFLVEAHAVPFVVNGMSPVAGFNAPEPRVHRPARAPSVYREFAKQGDGAVLLQLPLGIPDFDVRATYYSTVHWRPVVNGYSGFFPPHYGRLSAALTDIVRHPNVSQNAVRATGATHVIVHEGAYLGAEGAAISEWLRSWDAVEIYRDGTDVLFALPRS